MLQGLVPLKGSGVPVKKKKKKMQYVGTARLYVQVKIIVSNSNSI